MAGDHRTYHNSLDFIMTALLSSSGTQCICLPLGCRSVLFLEHPQRSRRFWTVRPGTAKKSKGIRVGFNCTGFRFRKLGVCTGRWAKAGFPVSLGQQRGPGPGLRQRAADCGRTAVSRSLCRGSPVAAPTAGNLLAAWREVWAEAVSDSLLSASLSSSK